ncbi:MAG: transcription termination/antitermination factor NusG [Bacteroidetes bacterium]|nr:transcription termination/antitermination factor NusG [Bacteroidota bacterium]
MSTHTPYWYVVRCISGQEKKVKQYLESEIERLHLQGNVLQILIPSEKVYEMRNGKKRSREKSLYPGYIFLEAMANPEIIQVIRDVPGVVGFLGADKGKTPIPMREIEVQKMLGQVTELEEMEEVMENPYAVGEEVKVMDGPFNGFTGLVEEVYDDKKKLKVAVKIFGRNTPLELNYLQVERIS